MNNRVRSVGVESVCVATLALIFSACSNLPPIERAQRDLFKAREDVKAGKVNKAMIEYRRASQEDPKLAVAHFELGKLYIGAQDFFDGARQMSTAIELDGSNIEARLALADILLLSKNYAEAKDEAEAVLALHPEQPEALLSLSRSLAGMNMPEEARTEVSQVLTLQPTNASAWLLLAGLQFQERDLAASERSFRRAIQSDPKQVEAVAAFTVLLLKEKRFSEAEQTIRESVAANPTSVGAQYILAAFLLQQGRPLEAEGAFRRLAELGQTDPLQRGALANFYLATKRPDLAEKEYLAIAGKYPDDSLNRQALVSLYLDNNQLSEAENLIAPMMRAHQDDSVALTLRGRLRLQEQHTDEAVADLERAIRADTRSAPAHYYLAMAKIQKGDVKLAEAELRNALELNPDFIPARTLLSGIQVNTGRLKEALSDLDMVVANKPDSVDPYIARSMILVQQGDLARAEKDLLPLLTQFPQGPQRVATDRALAWIMFDRKQYGRSRELLRHAAETDPDSRETLYLMALTYIAEGKVDAALAPVQAQIRRNPTHADGYELAGEVLQVANRYAESETFFRKALSVDPKLVPAWQGLAQVLIQQSKEDAALETLQQLLKQSPDSGWAYLRLAQLQDKRNNWSEAEIAYQKTLQFEPENVIAKNNLAWDYAEHGGNIDVALRLAEEASQLKPDDAEICDTLGWIYLKNHTPASAVEVFKKSVGLAPKNPEYNYHLATAYLQTGHSLEARRFLETALTLDPNSSHSEAARKMLVALKN